MNWPLPFKRSNSAPVARERLQVLLARERSAFGRSNMISILMEILDTISRHVAVEPDKVQVKMNRGAAVFTLEMGLEIPNTGFLSAAGEHAVGFLEEAKDQVLEAAA
jgi:cell division topological specificity factor